MQIITVEEILAGKEMTLPRVLLEKTFKKALKARMAEREGCRQTDIMFEKEEE